MTIKFLDVGQPEARRRFLFQMSYHSRTNQATRMFENTVRPLIVNVVITLIIAIIILKYWNKGPVENYWKNLPLGLKFRKSYLSP